MITSPKSRELLRSVLGTGLLVTVYRAALSVAAPGGNRENVPSKQIFKAERIKIDNKKFQNVKFFQIFIKIFLKSVKIFINFPKFVKTLTIFLKSQSLTLFKLVN